MQPSDSPFTNDADLKELPHSIDGTFAWVNDLPTHAEWAIGDERATELPDQLESALASAKENNVSLPTEFVAFIRNPDWHKRLRSATGCYLDVAESLLPFADGYLLRFLNDQQGCAFWYIFTNAAGSDHCVVSSYEHFDADEMDYEIEDLKETDFHIWASSFEGFMSRFWIENELMFADCDGTPPPDVDSKFLKLYAQ